MRYLPPSAERGGTIFPKTVQVWHFIKTWAAMNSWGCSAVLQPLLSPKASSSPLLCQYLYFRAANIDRKRSFLKITPLAGKDCLKSRARSRAAGKPPQKILESLRNSQRWQREGSRKSPGGWSRLRRRELRKSLSTWKGSVVLKTRVLHCYLEHEITSPWRAAGSQSTAESGERDCQRYPSASPWGWAPELPRCFGKMPPHGRGSAKYQCPPRSSWASWWQNKQPKKASAGKLLCDCRCLRTTSGRRPGSPRLILYFALENINKLLRREPSFTRICVLLVLFVRHTPQAEQGKLLRERAVGFNKNNF